MIMFMFNHLFTSGDPLPLMGVIFCSDRGYWNVLLMYIFGTRIELGWCGIHTMKRIYTDESLFMQSTVIVPFKHFAE